MKLFKTLLIYKLSFLLVFSLLPNSAAAAAPRRKMAARTNSKSTVVKKEAEKQELAQTSNGWRGTTTYLEKKANIG